jgi:hypothetical protein
VAEPEHDELYRTYRHGMFLLLAECCPPRTA